MRGDSEHQLEMARWSSSSRWPWHQRRRGSRGQRGVDPAAAMDGASPGGLRASSDTGWRREWQRWTTWWRTFCRPRAPSISRVIERVCGSGEPRHAIPGPLPVLYIAGDGGHQPYGLDAPRSGHGERVRPDLWIEPGRSTPTVRAGVRDGGKAGARMLLSANHGCCGGPVASYAVTFSLSFMGSVSR